MCREVIRKSKGGNEEVTKVVSLVNNGGIASKCIMPP